MTEENENSNLEENRLIAERREKLDALRLKGNAFPNEWRRLHLAAPLDEKYKELDKPTLEDMDEQVSVAGRIMAKRGPFIVIQDMSGRIQLYSGKAVQRRPLLSPQYGADPSAVLE